MTSDEARIQLDTAVEVVTAATGEQWEVEAKPGELACSQGLSQWHTSWTAAPTQDREAAYSAVEQALSDAGFTSSIFNEDGGTPTLVSRADAGFTLSFGPEHGQNNLYLVVRSDCFDDGSS